MSEIVSDREGALASDEGALWAEHWHVLLKFKPVGAHAQIAERHHEILRDMLHKLNSQLTQENIKIAKDLLVAECSYVKNAMISINGESPYQAVLGRFPQLLLEVEHVNQAAVQDDIGQLPGTSRHITRMREIAIQCIVSSTAKSRLQLAARTKTRVPVEAQQYTVGQQVEIWRAPSSKDLVGWRGPCEITNLNNLEDGVIDIRWQGRTMAVRPQDCRPASMFIFLSDHGDEPIAIVRQFLRGISHGLFVFAFVHGPTGWCLSKTAKEHKEVYASILHIAAFELGISKCVGARLGRCIASLSGLYAVETCVLLWWPCSHPGLYKTWQHPGQATVDLKVLFKGEIFEEVCWVQFMSTSKSQAKQLRHDFHDMPTLALDLDEDMPQPDDDDVTIDERDTHMPPLSSRGATASMASTRAMSTTRVAQHIPRPRTPTVLTNKSDNTPMPTIHERRQPPPSDPSTEPVRSSRDRRSARAGSSTDAAAASTRAPSLPATRHGPHSASTVTLDEDLPRSAYDAAHDSDGDFSLSEQGTINAEEDIQEDWVGFIGAAITQIAKTHDELSPADIDKHWAEVWEAAKGEVQSFFDLSTFLRVNRQGAENVLSCRWLFKFKRTPAGKIVKARLCIRGFEDRDAATLATFAGTATRWGQRVVVSVSAQNKWTLSTADVGCAFLRGLTFERLAELTGEPLRVVHFDPPAKFAALFTALPGMADTDWSRHTLKMVKPIYGLKDAPRCWRKQLHISLTGLGGHALLCDPALYCWKHEGGLVLLLSTHVDDLKLTGEDEWVAWLLAELTTQFGTLKTEIGIFEHCGLQHTQDPVSYSVKVDQNHYTPQLQLINLTNYDTSDESLAAPPELVAAFQSLLGGLSWLTQTRMDLCVYIQSLQRASHNPNFGHLLRVNRVTRWAKRKPMHVQYNKLPGSSFRVCCISDAAFRREDATGLALRGAIIGIGNVQLGDPGGDVHLIEWFSKRQRRIVRSTFGAELNALADAFEISKVVAYTYAELMLPVYADPAMLRGLEDSGGLPLTIEASIDCRSVFDSLASEQIKQPTESSLIMLLLQLKQCLRLGSLSKLWWISTGDMAADGLNKGAISRAGLMITSCSGYWTLRESTMHHSDNGSLPLELSDQPGPE
jgi:hypothetical protein